MKERLGAAVRTLASCSTELEIPPSGWGFNHSCLNVTRIIYSKHLHHGHSLSKRLIYSRVDALARDST